MNGVIWPFLYLAMSTTTTKNSDQKILNYVR